MYPEKDGTMALARRPLFLLGLVFALVGASCAGGNAADEGRPSAEFVGTFELTGEVIGARPGETPDADVPRVTGEPPTEQARHPGGPGVLELRLASVGDTIPDDCGAEVRGDAAVFWTPETFVDPPGALEGAEALEGETVEATGRYAPVDFDPGSEDLDENPCLYVATAMEVGEIGTRSGAVDLSRSFAFTGEVTDAELGAAPSVDLPAIGEDAPSETARRPDDRGLLRVEVSSAGEALAAECAAAEGERVEVFWTTDTFFDPGDVVEGESFPEGLRGRRVDVSGRLDSLDLDGEGETPDERPCLFVATVIDVVEEGG